MDRHFELTVTQWEPRDVESEAEETEYQSVADYDPVLRAHCRLDGMRPLTNQRGGEKDGMSS